jgi:hypothetical protein
MRVIEHASGEPQVCGALSALCTAITSDAVRPAFQIAANPSALISKGLPLVLGALPGRGRRARSARYPIDEISNVRAIAV